MNRLDARIALITGAASGIGLATARRFAEEGAKVVMADRNEDALSSVRASLRGDGHQTVTMDVTDERAWAALAERIDASSPQSPIRHWSSGDRSSPSISTACSWARNI